VECGQTTGVPTPPSGWAHVTNSPRAQGSNVHAISVMWLRAATSAETDPVVPAQANHQTGCRHHHPWRLASGSPEDTGAAGVNSNLSTSLSVALGSTSVADCLVVFAGGSAATSLSDQYGTFTNASLTSVTKQTFAATTDGNGGSVDVITGSKATAGACGTFTATQSTSTQWSGIGIAIQPAASGAFTGTASLAATSTHTAAGVVGAFAAATLATAAALTGAGSVGSSTGAALSATATITAAGAVGTASGATLSGTGTLTASGTVGVSSGAAIAATGTLTAAGSVSATGGSGATLAAVDAITAAGTVGTATGASLAATDAISAAGSVGVATGATLPATGSLSATGQVGRQAGASLAGTAVISAAGSVTSGIASSATLAATGTITAAGRVGLSGSATLAATVVITATAPTTADPNPATLTIREHATVTLTEARTAMPGYAVPCRRGTPYPGSVGSIVCRSGKGLRSSVAFVQVKRQGVTISSPVTHPKARRRSARKLAACGGSSLPRRTLGVAWWHGQTDPRDRHRDRREALPSALPARRQGDLRDLPPQDDAETFRDILGNGRGDR
jgi:hypothetical protein